MALAVALSTACGEGPLVPTSGAIRIVLTTIGADPDADGYAVTLDGAAPRTVGVNGTLVLRDLGTGAHSVTLAGLAANCTAGGENPRAVTVRAGDTLQVAFAVVCVAVTGTIEIKAATSGADVDPDGYTVQVDGGTTAALAVSGTTRFEGLSAGSHTVTLAGAATNCPVAADNPRTVSVTTGAVKRDTARTTFQVICVATTAVIEVAAVTSGIDLDPDGYTVQVDGGASRALAVSGTIRFEGLGAGSHTVTMTGAAANCPIAPDNPRTVNVTTGAVTRDTARTKFQVTCGAATGSIQVTTATSGIDLDPNGYAMQIDGGSLRLLLGAGTVTIDGLAGGDHSVVLSGAAGNCTVGGDNPRVLHVITGGAARDTARTLFQVTCVAVTGSIEVKAATTGVDFTPNGYTVLIDVGSLAPLPVNGAATIGGLSAGDHTVRLVGSAGNCTITGDNPRAVHVTTGGVTRDTARTTFSVSCVAATGSIQVTTATAGMDLDPDGYTVLLDNGQQRPLGDNGTTVIEGVSAGDHSVILFGAVGNCALAGNNPRTVHVTTGGSTRDTVRTTFQLTCVRVEKIAFQSGASVDQAIIAVAYADGSNTVTLARGTGPSWSPDGTKIAFAAIDYYCDYYYYDCYYYPVGLALMSADGSGLVFLTNEASDAQPTWSPDGTRIAFISSRNGRSGVYVLNAGVPTLLTNTPRAVSKPAWSPDGTRLAFTCEVDSGNSDICVINANGTGFTRLTSDPGQDAGPAWKPDGSRIAFATTRYAGAYELASMTPDGGDVTRLSPATAASDPAWKPDGTKLVVANLVCGSSSGCSSRGLLVMTAGGTGLTTVSAGADYAPAWRP
ncbi:MAG: hypothetical protein AUI13_00160 [Gemmatimonadetes bacterium 13_2_20CM_2_69_23]|nr:MAG: hypothetical protein AUI13_00160 [Gemmatimonadetes bacterium 13_2_20CM_2_69_23]